MAEMRRRTLLLFVVGVVLFGFPALLVVDRVAVVLGLPLVPLYLFTCWAILIIAAFVVIEVGRS